MKSRYKNNKSPFCDYARESAIMGNQRVSDNRCTGNNHHTEVNYTTRIGQHADITTYNDYLTVLFSSTCRQCITFIFPSTTITMTYSSCRILKCSYLYLVLSWREISVSETIKDHVAGLVAGLSKTSVVVVVVVVVMAYTPMQ